MMIPSDLQDYGFEHMFGTWNKRNEVGAFRIDLSPLDYPKNTIKIATNTKPYRGLPGSSFILDRQHIVYKLETVLKLARLYGFV